MVLFPGLAGLLARCMPASLVRGIMHIPCDLEMSMTEAQVFNGFGCTGKNISPALKWSGAPKDT